MTTTLYTYGAARQASRASRPWKVRLEYRGADYKNDSGRAAKFWEVSGSGGFGSLLTLRFGKLGSHGQTQTKSWDWFAKKIGDKLYHKRTPYSYASGTIDSYEPPAPAKPKAPALTPLTGPFAMVRWLRQAKDLTWECLDINSTFLFTVPEQSAASLLAYPKIKVTGTPRLAS